MFDKIVKIVSILAFFSAAGFYLTAFTLNWRELRKQDEVKKSKKYE